MQRYSENQIHILHSEFRNQKKYADKLAFFDRLFGIIPFNFPDFDSCLGFLFQKEKMDVLADYFKKERNNPELTEKKFFYEETYVFNIKPANSNSAAYSSYILNSFLNRQPVFEAWISQKINVEKPVEFLLDEANGLVNKIEYCLQNEYDKSFRLQCMSVFYKGFQEAFTNKFHLPDKKRKFIELFLYAQGIIYSNYVNALKVARNKLYYTPGQQSVAPLDLKAKLDLLNEIGIIEFLKRRYAGMDIISFENKMAEIFCLLLDTKTVETKNVIALLREIERKSQKEFRNGLSSAADRNTFAESSTK